MNITTTIQLDKTTTIQLDKTFEWPEIFTKYPNTTLNTGMLLEAFPEMIPDQESFLRQYFEKQPPTKQHTIKQLIMVWNNLLKLQQFSICDINLLRLKLVIQNLKQDGTECIYYKIAKEYFFNDNDIERYNTILHYCLKNNKCSICELASKKNVFELFDIQKFDIEKMEYANVLIHGDNGCGKTTLSKHLQGIFQKTKKIDQLTNYSNLSIFSNNHFTVKDKRYLLICDDIHQNNYIRFSNLVNIYDTTNKLDVTCIVQSTFGLGYQGYKCKYKFFGKHMDMGDPNYFQFILGKVIKNKDTCNYLMKNIPNYSWLVVEYETHDQDNYRWNESPNVKVYWYTFTI